MIFDLTQLTLESTNPNIIAFWTAHFEEWVSSTIVDSCKAFARAAGMSERYMSSIKFARLGPLRCEVYLDYFGPKGEPLGLWFEEGTKPHPIVAKYAPFLYFFWPKLKKYVSFKRVNHPGTKGLHIMRNGAKFGMPRLNQKIITETDKYLRERSFV